MEITKESLIEKRKKYQILKDTIEQSYHRVIGMLALVEELLTELDKKPNDK